MSLAKLIPLYFVIFAICYSGTMLLKYLTHDNMTWFRTAALMFGITSLIALLKRLPGRRAER